ncbi:MAG: mechanosensitive ion channel family protein, partial [Psychrobacter glacincola]
MEFLGFTLDVATLTNSALSIAAKVMLALLIFIVGRWLAKKAVAVAHRLMLRSRLDDTVANFLGRLIYGLLLVVVVLAALSKVGVQTTS